MPAVGMIGGCGGMSGSSTFDVLSGSFQSATKLVIELCS